jgi:hypothetical protein
MAEHVVEAAFDKAAFMAMNVFIQRLEGAGLAKRGRNRKSRNY